MRIVFLMDPLAGVRIDKDTSFQLMLAAQERGHEIWHLAPGALAVRDGHVRCRATPLRAQRDQTTPFITQPPQVLAGADIDLVLVRTDPPFDAAYLQATWLLDLLPPHVAVVNSPHGLRSANEKLWACRFPDLTPRTLITTDSADYLEFLAEERRVVVKPTDGFGGAGVFVVAAGDANARVVFETLSGGGRRELVVQEYLNAATRGDKRILLLDGEALGAVLRRHGGDDHRNNFFAGGTAHAADITAADTRIIERLAPHLRALGLAFVGIDVIGDKLVEVNVTSPTCLQEMQRLGKQGLDDRVIAWLEAHVAARRGESEAQ